MNALKRKKHVSGIQFEIEYPSVCFLKSLNKEDPVLYTKDFYMNFSKYNLHLQVLVEGFDFVVLIIEM